jgi:hypothetical protein
MVLLLLSARGTTFAAGGTWDLNPGSGDWNTGTNWSSGTVPNGASDIATFDISNTTAVGISANTTVAGITFNSGASVFTITVEGNQDLFFLGAGITNNSGVTQNFVAANVGGLAGDIFFESASSTAGSMTHFTDTGSSTMGSINSGTFFDGASSTAGSATFIQTGGTASNGFGGFVNFEGALSSAGTGTFINQAGTSSGGGGFTEFDGTTTMAATATNATITNDGGATLGAYGLTIFTTISTAANATITNDGGTASGADGGQTDFFNSSTAGSATITNNAGAVAGAIGGSTQFSDTSATGNATLIANGGLGGGGSIQFFNSSAGGTARVEVFNNGTGTPGNLDISSHVAPGVTIGSLEGSGNVFLGGRNLTVGSNNMSTTFSGVIQDGGIGGGTGGSLTKIGTGTHTLSGANTYTGGTMVNAGALLVNNTTGSGTGSGSVTANSGGILGGTGTISGPVTISSGAVLLGGKGSTPTGALTIANNLTLNSGSTIELVLGASGTHSTLTRTGGTWTFAANQAFTFINGGAQPGVYDNIITGLAADPGTEGSWTITNPGFAGTFTYDGAGNIDLTLTAAHPQLSSAASQKLHTGVGTFPVTLPLNGTLGIECRSGGTTGDYQLVITFTNSVSVNGNPQAGVTSGQGQVGTGGASNGGAVTVSGSSVTVPLTNVANAQAIAVTLFSVNDGANTGDVIIPMSVLIGDTTANGAVNSSDIAQTQSKSGQVVDSSNFREDVTVNGSINSSDIALVQSKSGTALPAGSSQSPAATTTAPKHRSSPEKSF